MGGELNELTRQLFAQGYTKDKHPDTVRWGTRQNFEYSPETMAGFTWETPCRLLIEGRSDTGEGIAHSDTFYQHIWYCPENDNPLLRCPHGQKGCEHIPAGFPLPMCPCHRTDQPYDYERSVEKIQAEHNRKVRQRYMELTGGSYCACVANSGSGGPVYDVDMCIQAQCKNSVCVLRKQPRNLKQVNIFYDVRRTWITRRGFLEETKVEITKGLKLFKRPVARTDAEIWLNAAANQSPLVSSSTVERPVDGEYDYVEFHYDVENICIARSARRNSSQDMKDEAAGATVFHAVDLAKEAAVQKRAAKLYRKKLRARRAQKEALLQDEAEQVSFL